MEEFFIKDVIFFIPIVSLATSVLLAKIFLFSLLYPVNKKRIFIFEVQGLIYFYREKIVNDLANFLEKEINKETSTILKEKIEVFSLVVKEKSKKFIKEKFKEIKTKLDIPDYVFFVLESVIFNLIEELVEKINQIIKEEIVVIEKEKIGTKVKNIIIEQNKKIENKTIKELVEKRFNELFDLFLVYSAVLGLVVGVIIDVFILIWFF